LPAGARPLGGGPAAIRTAGLVPTVEKVAPNKGPEAGGTGVTITGTNFTGATAVTFGSTPAKSFKVESPTTIAAQSPAGTGKVDVTVTTPEGTSAKSSADEFTYLPVPTVEKVAPNKGPEAGGTGVTITGTNFTGATAVTFGSTPAKSFKVESPTTIAAQSPAGTGKVDVTVTTPEGTSAKSSADEFTYVELAPPPPPLPPAVTSIAPSGGPESGGTAVTITGANLEGATAVRFGASPAASFKVNSSSSITATSPAGKGKVDVTVTTAGGTSATSAADSFAYAAPPPPPPPPPTAMCTMKPIFLTIERKHKGKARPKITAGQLRVTVTCSHAATASLTGRLVRLIGKKPKHGKQRTKVYRLGPTTTTVAQGVASMVSLKLPLNALVTLAAKAKESVRITLSATNAGGVTRNSVNIKQLKL